ncbi:MAG: hypothetical protein HY205_02475 [Nitrospirae bacterium]|nr:hypothetical protein [Nitrospirota bacterium]
MTGRAEVERLKISLDATFKRATSLNADAELLSDFARHLCVLISGFLEQAVIELALEHVRNKSQQSVVRYVERRLRQFTNAKAQRLITLFGDFDPDWRTDLEAYLIDERKDAVDGIVDLRNKIAHGQFVGLTMVRARDYYERIKDIVDHIADLCVPVR